MYKGIILAGGNGTRLYPSTKIISKQLLPIYDKPMIYYSLSILMLAQIREILIISTARDIDKFKELLGDGSEYGISLTYAIQNEPNGLAEAFLIAEDFLLDSPSCLVLGDNIFYGNGLIDLLINAKNKAGATIFAYEVADAKPYGVVTFDKNNIVTNIEEKPTHPKSNFAVTGVYFYDNNVVKYAKILKPSKRGELEITDLNNIYLANAKLNVITMGRGFAWLDTGTHDSMLAASNFIQTLEHRQNIKVACLEEIAYLNKWLSKVQIEQKLTHANLYNNSYVKYLEKIIAN